jgi:cytochrome c553
MDLAALMLPGLLAMPAHSASGDIALGEYLSAECVTCHQLSGASAGGVPPIVGIPEEAFVAALMAYKTGIRENQVMRGVAARLSPDEMAALAAYFVAQKP